MRRTSFGAATWILLAMSLAPGCTDPAAQHFDALDVDATAPDPLPSDACVARAPNHPHVHGHEYVYVIDALTIDRDRDAAVAGFDLDDRYSDGTGADGCGHADRFSRYHDQPNCGAVDSDGRCITSDTSDCVTSSAGCRGGVDNMLITIAADQLPGAATIGIEQALSNALNDGRVAILIRLDNVDDDRNDPSVDVYLYNAFPEFDTECWRFRPDRAYAVDRNSLIANGGSIDDAAFHAIGAIREGRLYVASCMDSTFSRIGFPWIHWGSSPQPDWHATHVAADVSSDRLTRGALGAFVRADDVFAAEIQGEPGYSSLIVEALHAYTDIELDSVCSDLTATPPHFGGISFGYGLDAVRAAISPTHPIAESATPGMCGAPPLPRDDDRDARVAPSDVPPAPCFFPDGGSGIPDFANDRDNCGGCGYACCNGQQCIGGHCDPGCAAGETVCVIEPSGGRCSTVCADLRSNPNHCGRCGLACSAGTTCVDFMCR